jgi:predicted nucleic acid-binding protein
VSTSARPPAVEHVLCDTSFISVVSSPQRSRNATAHWPDHVKRRLDGALLAMSVISIAELRAGHIAAGWGEQRRANAERLMAAYLWVPLDMGVVDRCAELRAEKRRHGWRLGDNDLWIAATAETREWPLVACDLGFCDLPELELIYLPARPDSLSACPE